MLLAAILFAGVLTLWIPARWALSAFQLAILLYAAQRILLRLRTGRAMHAPLAAWLIASVVAWTLIQAAAGWSIDPARTLDAALDWSVRLAAFALALDLYSDAPRREAFLRGILVFGCVLSVAGIFTVLTSPPGVVFWMFDSGTGVPTIGPFLYKNQFAALIEAILPITVTGAIARSSSTAHGPSRGFGWATQTLAAALMLAAVIAAGSRAGVILCFAEILIIPAVAFRQRRLSGRLFLRAIAGSVAAVILLAAVVGWEPLWNRLRESNPYSLRRDLVASSIEMTRARPWTGFGIGAWSTAYPAFAHYDDGTFVNQAHNDWAQWAAEGGFPMFALALAIAATLVRPAIRSLWGIGILAVFLHSLVDYPLQQRPALAAFFFSLMGAVSAGMANKEKTRGSRMGTAGEWKRPAAL